MPGNVHNSYVAYAALIERIKTIRGSSSGHWTNLGDRVYTRYFVPSEELVGLLPYVCIPIDRPDGRLVWDQGTIVRDHWNISIYAFVPDTSSSLRDGTAVENALKLKDDILDVMLSDCKLGGAVENSTIPGWDLIAGDDADVRYGELVVPVQLEVFLSREALGP